MSLNENRETNMDINKEIPQTDEKAMENLTTEELIQVLEDSEKKSLAEKILLQRWKSKMFEACETGKTRIVELLLERMEHYNCEETGLNVKDDRGMTPFMLACQNRHKDVVKMLLDHSKSN